MLRIWAVDVSGYSLWQAGLKDGTLIESCLASSVAEQAKVKRYLREVDQIRSLAGKLLVRLALVELGHDLHWSQLTFHTTKEGRPYLASPQLDFDFNITHDGDWVAIAFVGSLGKQLTMTSAANVGIDVMEIQLPKFEKSVLDFVDTMDMTLTPRERDWILSDYTHDTFVTQHDRPSNLSLLEYDQLKKLYTLWTYKEAFTKAKGMGLGYDFQTIEIVKLGDEVSITAADKAEKGLSIFQMVLPPGQSSARKAGGGTGLSSLLVVFELTKEEAISSRTMDVSQAQQEGMLRLWTMDRLVDASRQAMEQG